MNKRWKVILSFVVVFCAGAVVGGVYTQWRCSPNHDTRNKHKEDFSDRVMRHYVDRLKLSEEQVAKIRPIVTAASEEMRSIRTEWFKDTRVVADKMNHDVAEVLTPEQKIEFEKYNREMEERWKRMTRRKPPEPPKGERPPPPPRG